MEFEGLDPGAGLGGVPLRFNGQGITANVGQMVWQVNGVNPTPPDVAPSFIPAIGSDFVTFCIELSQYVSSADMTYTLTDLATAPNPDIAGSVNGYHIGAERAAALYRLANLHWIEATGTDLVASVAFQFAVWEIVHEFGTMDAYTDVNANKTTPALAADLDVEFGEGTFYINVASPTGTLLGAINKANQWLTGISNWASDPDNLTGIPPSVWALTNSQQQDQLIWDPTAPRDEDDEPVAPEPVSLAVWGGLAALCWVCARRRQGDR